MNFKEGFISFPFLILLSLCLSLSSYLSYKIMVECRMMESLKEVNFQVQHERKILEIIYCLIQCDVPDSVFVEVDEMKVLLRFEDDLCFVSDAMCSLVVEVDYDDKILKNVKVEK
ncbi:MAG: hypothetical protein IKU28_08275 [Erysipelotrichaceae bacterium]|nr:hypothetical protein [Erysipelotrichaceae bacterium]